MRQYWWQMNTDVANGLELNQWWHQNQSYIIKVYWKLNESSEVCFLGFYIQQRLRDI